MLRGVAEVDGVCDSRKEDNENAAAVDEEEEEAEEEEEEAKLVREGEGKRRACPRMGKNVSGTT